MLSFLCCAPPPPHPPRDLALAFFSSLRPNNPFVTSFSSFDEVGNGGEATFGERGRERQGKEGVTGQGRQQGSDDAFRFSFDDAFLGKKMSPS